MPNSGTVMLEAGRTAKVSPEDGEEDNVNGRKPGSGLRLNIPLTLSVENPSDLHSPNSTSAVSDSGTEFPQGIIQWDQRRRSSIVSNNSNTPSENGSRKSSDASRSKVPGTPYPGTAASSTRPNTASSLVYNKLHAQRVDEGWLSVMGCSISSYCHVIVLVMSGFFLLGGAILTVVTFSPAKEERTFASRMAGPLLVIIGIIMFCAGIILCLINWKVSRDARERHYLQKHFFGGNTGSRPESRWSTSKSVTETYMPTISHALSFGLSNTPAIGVPVVVDYPLLWKKSLAPSRRLSLHVSPTRPTLDQSHSHDGEVGASSASATDGGGGSSSSKFISRRVSYPTTPYDGGRRGSMTRQAGLITEAKQELSNINSRLFASSSSPSASAPSSPTTSFSPPPPYATTTSASSSSAHPQTPGSGRLRRDVACFPVSILKDSNGERMVHGMIDIPEDDTLPEIQITEPKKPEEPRKSVHFTGIDGGNSSGGEDR